MLIYRFKQLLLVFGDFVSFILAFLLSITLRYFKIPDWEKIKFHLLLFLIVYIFWIIVNYINGLYDLGRLTNDRSFYRRFSETAIISLIISITFFYLFPDKQIAPKTILLANIFLGYGISAIWRLSFQKILGAEALKNNLIFVGFTNETKELIDILNKEPEKGYEVKALIDPTNEVKPITYKFDVYHNLNTIRPAITNHKAQLVIIAPHLHQNSEALRELYELLFWDVQLTDLTSFYEQITGRIPPSTFSDGWFLQNLQDTQQPIYDRFRTIIDLIFGIILGLCLLILLPIITLAIKLNSPGPIFYKQKRIGQFGEIFWIYKLRSMHVLSSDGSAEVGEYEFDKWVAKKKDNRITTVGKFLRRTRIDEWPQAINLLKRELTLIGPRPERPEIVDDLKTEMPYYPLRHVVKPGLTGWALIHQNYTSTREKSIEKLQYDLYYIKNRSLLLDIVILLRTTNVLMRLMGQ